MHLKTLELQGFKSFPDKTVLTFDEKVTAVVGPNGSGKSNISDAIRWVLGEQSVKTLRGGKMEDVIFGGTPGRKRQGFAEVSLVLDNADGQLDTENTEVMVTRRYYRSGESEYYLNRRLVRLKDINELFMDTGLGQEGYALIGQGRIDEILSAKGTQRREIFEEAAGISRYRHRKEEAERKLERTRENLVRIGDKIEELELQIEPLSQQAQRAQTYQKLREELRVLEISLWMTQLRAVKERETKIHSDYDTAVGQLAQVQARADAQYAKTEQLNGLVLEKEAEGETLRGEHARLEGAAREETHGISLLRERIRSNEAQIQQMKREQAAQQDRAGGLEAQILQMQEKESSFAQEEKAGAAVLATLGETLAGLEEKAAGATGRMQKLERELEGTEQSARQIRNRLSGLEATEAELASRSKGAKETLDGLSAQLDQVMTAQTREKAEKGDLERNQSRLEEELRRGKAQLSSCRQQEKAAEEGWMAQRMTESSLSSRIHMLSDMEKLYDGYSKGVKCVMKGELPGVHGPVGGLLRVPPAYAVAIEITLGGAMQNLVVDSEEVGKTVLRYVRQRDAGRVTCLPMTAIRAAGLRETGMDQIPGYVGIAAQLVEADDAYHQIVSYLLGRVVVVQTLDNAVVMSRRYPHRFQIVTLEGEVINAGGAMTGGSIHHRGGILSRAAELKTLQEKQRGEQEKLREKEAALATARQNTAQAVGALEQLQRNSRENRDALLTVTSRLESRMALQRTITRQVESEKAALVQLQQRTDGQKSQAEASRETLAQMETKAADLRQERTELVQQQQREQEKREAIREDLRQKRETLAGVVAGRKSTQQMREELERLQAAFSTDSARQRTTLERIEEENKALLAEIEAKKNQVAELEEKAGKSAADMDRSTREKLVLEKQRSQSEKDSREENDRQMHLERETAVLEQKKVQAAMEESQLLEKLWDTYQVTHEGATQLQIALDSTTKASRRIGELNGAIRGLGTVNLGAIEEYQRVRQRYDYLAGQRADVETAGAQLETIIRGMTGQMEEIFQREFQRIGQAFRSTFAELFGGGNADLELEDPADVLNCGIEIRVQPPGKTLRTLSLLSGGERAFVAIALYFAILKVRPTPFCVMDEIEAALDEANVTRFVRYLRTVSDKTQFILITHRRGTMEESDVLYGVTMENRGISRILTLNLKEAEAQLSLGG